MRFVRAAKRFGIAAACVSLAWACTLFNPLDAYGPPKNKGANDDGSSSTDDARDPKDDGSTGGCAKEKWPARPAQDGTGGTPVAAELIFALETLDVGHIRQDAGAGQVSSGFDLDNACTCPEPPSCTGAAGAKLSCDKDGGIDNGGTDLLEVFIQLAGKDLEFTELLQSGEQGFILRLDDYNGSPDDTKVKVALFLSGGSDGAQGGTPKVPLHDGEDVWTVDPTFLFGGKAPPYVPNFADTNAYVAGGTIVANIDNAPLRMGNIEVKLNGMVLTARLVRDAQQKLHLTDGRIAGRWKTKDLLTTLDGVKSPVSASTDGGSAGLCGDDQAYQDIKKKICGGVDILSDPKQDNTPASCDALAVTLLFTAGPAKLGVVFPARTQKHRCGEGWEDDCVR